MEKGAALTDYTVYSASVPVVFYVACPAAQSAQCSCVACGSDEVAGWRWGFPALA